MIVLLVESHLGELLENILCTVLAMLVSDWLFYNFPAPGPGVVGEQNSLGEECWGYVRVYGYSFHKQAAPALRVNVKVAPPLIRKTFSRRTSVPCAAKWRTST